MRPGLLVVLLLAVLTSCMVAGCGTGAQPAPQPVDIPAGPPAPVPDGTAAVRIYLVRDGRLVGVTRRAQPSPDAALALIAAGPTAAESAAGLRTALSVRPLAVRTDPEDPRTALAHVTVGFTELPGRDRLLAAAQLVWTLTESPAVRRVEVLLDGRRLAVSTDAGPRRSPVRRADFRSVAPR